MHLPVRPEDLGDLGPTVRGSLDELPIGDGGPERCARCRRRLGSTWDLVVGEGAVCPIPSAGCG